MVYLSDGMVHASDTRRRLNTNIGRGGMKRLMEEAAARHVEAIHYSASVGIRVGEKAAQPDSKSGFWPVILETLSGGRLKNACAKSPGGATPLKKAPALSRPRVKTMRH